MNIPDPFENMSVPNPTIQPDERLKLTLLSTRQSSLIGIALVAAPAVFLFSMVMKHELGIDLHVFALIGRFFESFDKHPLTRHWFSPLVFGLLPLAAVAINVLSILHVAYSRERRLLTLTIKVKALNLLAVLFAGAVLGAVFAYQFAETFRGRE
jgi:hypothetical protein